LTPQSNYIQNTHRTGNTIKYQTTEPNNLKTDENIPSIFKT